MKKDTIAKDGLNATGQIRNVLQYWRNSLVDMDKMSLSANQTKKFIFTSQEIKNGAFLNDERIQAIFAGMQQNSNKKRDKKMHHQNEDKIDKIQVLVCPYTASGTYEYGKRIYNNDVYPLWMSAILTKDGLLLPNEQKMLPWIERRCLQPTEDTGRYPIISTVDVVDEFYNTTPSLFAENTPLWNEFFLYAMNLFDFVMGHDANKKFANVSYNFIESGYIVPFNNTSGASENIIKTYDQYIIKPESIPTILKKMAVLEPVEHIGDKAEAELFHASRNHLGQMQNQYPLSASQRVSLSYFFDDKNNDIFTVNGPPGTGKTSLLLSVIASLWVERAIQQAPPPIIVATSTNNLAITNIVDNLNKISEQDNNENLRWLPRFSSYGLYLSAYGKEDDAVKNNYIYKLKQRGSGNIDKFYDDNYRKEAKDYFLYKFNKYFDLSENDVVNCVEKLHFCLLENKKLLDKVIVLVYEYYQFKLELAEQCICVEHIDEQIAKIQNKFGCIINKLKNNKKEQAEWLSYKSHQLKWLRVFAWVSSVNNILQDKIKYYITMKYDFFSEITPDLATIDSFFDKHIEKDELIYKETKATIAQLESIKQKNDKLVNELSNIKTQLGYDFNLDNLFDFADSASLLSKLDTTLRYKLFFLATHYWEAKWLEESANLADLRYSLHDTRRYWEIQAMLTPCFITTAYSGPAFFQYHASSDNFDTLSNFIDLLIMDEAGQVLPAIAGGIVSITKRVLLVGDMQQIEPICILTESIDFGNTKKFKVCADKDDFDRMKQLGILCSSDVRRNHSYGNMITLGQNKAKFKLKNNKLSGMFLKEHRRCAKAIISYCNELCYDGQLIPMSLEKPCIYPRMGYAHIKGNTEAQGCSRINWPEAEAIVQWIKKNQNEILAQFNKQRLDDCIGIITPFSAQAKIIKKILEENNLEISKVGTVHLLQGAEKPLVIFSSVYTSYDNKGQFFFDLSPNMLNVAVSRAKDSFLVFGDIDIFDPSAYKKPSALLAKYLFSNEENEITDIIQPKFNSIKDEIVIQINTLEEHCKQLRTSFFSAENELTIVSPYLSIYAINHDKILDLIAENSSRILINIYTDPSLKNDDKNYQNKFSYVVELLAKAGANVVPVRNIHSKIIAIDDRVIIAGSFNWLSAARVAKDYRREEYSILYQGRKVETFIQEALEPIKIKVNETCKV